MGEEAHAAPIAKTKKDEEVSLMGNSNGAHGQDDAKYY